MCYLQSHFILLKLAYSSIRFLLFVCLAAHVEEFLDGLPEMSNCYCHPGKAGGSPFGNRRNRCHRLRQRLSQGRPQLTLCSTPTRSGPQPSLALQLWAAV